MMATTMLPAIPQAHCALQAMLLRIPPALAFDGEARHLLFADHLPMSEAHATLDHMLALCQVNALREAPPLQSCACQRQGPALYA